MARRSGVGTQRHHLHRRNLQGSREIDFRQGRGAAGPSHLFNSSLEGNTRRAIDIHEGDKIDDKALQALVRAAVDCNQVKLKKKAPASIGTSAKREVKKVRS